MAVTISFNSRKQDIASIEALGQALEHFDEVPEFELWASVAEGPSLCMLRNRENAWLMYLRHEGDSGFNSLGQTERIGNATYIFSNGQEDEYPLAWCVEVEQCYKAVAYFYINNGLRPEWIHWHES
jgi:hypothetical protein